MNRCYACYQEIDNPGIHPKCSRKIFGTAIPPSLKSLSEELEDYAHEFIAKKITITGVQKKLSLHHDPREETRFTIVGAMGGNYILKPPSLEFEELPELEDLSMHLAKLVGLEVALHCLMPMKDGQLAYVTKRFDRERKRKVAQEDACQLSELLTENKYRSSHERLAQIIRRYSSFVGDDLLRLFELTLTSFICGNGDMHLKNFSLLQNKQGHYRLSPAYDLVPTRLLIPAHEDPEELALNLNGKKSRFKREDFLYYADYMGLETKVVERSLKRFQKAFPSMLAMVEMSFLSDGMKVSMKELLKERVHRLGIVAN